MRYFSLFLSPILIFVAFLTQLPLRVCAKLPSVPKQLTTIDVHAFPNGTWVENMAIRKSGEILVTLYSAPEVYQVDPFDLRPYKRATLIHKFADQRSILGITEVQNDVFAVAVAKEISSITGFAEGFSIWTIDVRNQGKATKVVEIPDAGVLNGLVTLDKQAGTILVADSLQGVVYRVSIPSRTYSIVINDPTMKTSQAGSIPLGVNGLKIQGNSLFYTNSNKGTIASIPIKKDGTPSGPALVISNLGGVIDDLSALDEKATTFVAGGLLNTIIRVDTRTGVAEMVAGDVGSPVFYNPTATLFGRTRRDSGVLYVTTVGGQAEPIPGVPVQGGKIVAVYGL